MTVAYDCCRLQVFVGTEHLVCWLRQSSWFTLRQPFYVLRIQTYLRTGKVEKGKQPPICCGYKLRSDAVRGGGIAPLSVGSRLQDQMHCSILARE